MSARTIVFSIFMLLPSHGFAQETLPNADYVNDEFSWTSCEKLLPPDYVENVFSNISYLFDEFRNEYPGLQMATPLLETCQLQVGEPGTFLAGASFVNFYPSNDWMTCVERGTSCEDTSNGYSATAFVRFDNGEAIGMEYVVGVGAAPLRFCIRADGTTEFDTCLE